MRFEAQCPGCGVIVKQEATTGRYDYHGWTNGCQITHEDQMPGRVGGGEPKGSRDVQVETRLLPASEATELGRRAIEAAGHFRSGFVALRGEDAIFDLGPLRVALSEVIMVTLAVQDAARAVAAGYPLACSFDDGRPAPALPEPYQARALIRRAHDARSGKRPANRICTERTRGGGPCKAKAQRFIERSVCSSHGTAEERLLNQQRMKAWSDNHPFIPEQTARAERAKVARARAGERAARRLKERPPSTSP